VERTSVAYASLGPRVLAHHRRHRRTAATVGAWSRGSRRGCRASGAHGADALLVGSDAPSASYRAALSPSAMRAAAIHLAMLEKRCVMFLNVVSAFVIGV
jgi:hypothetical protein